MIKNTFSLLVTLHGYSSIQKGSERSLSIQNSLNQNGFTVRHELKFISRQEMFHAPLSLTMLGSQDKGGLIQGKSFLNCITV